MQEADLGVVEGHEVVSATLVRHVEAPPRSALDLPTAEHINLDMLLPHECVLPLP